MPDENGDEFPFEEDDNDGEYPPPYYTEDRVGRLNMPFSCDCSGLVWWSYHQMGLADALFPSPDAGVSEMVAHFESTNWRSADLIMRWNDSPQSTEAARAALNQEGFLQRGDLLYRVSSPSGAGDHVAFFIGWDGDQLKVSGAFPTGEPVVGERTLSYTYFVDTYTHVVRPMPVGMGMSYRYSAGINQPVSKPVEVQK